MNTSVDADELWEQLDSLGLSEVKIKLAQGVYGERKRKLVEEWVHQKEQKGDMIPPEDPKREALFQELKLMDKEVFKLRIAQVEDDGLLSYLRYEFGWDPDPRKSTWQTIEINRLLTKRKDWRLVRPTWIGVAVATIIGIASFIVAILGL